MTARKVATKQVISVRLAERLLLLQWPSKAVKTSQLSPREKVPCQGECASTDNSVLENNFYDHILNLLRRS